MKRVLLSLDEETYKVWKDLAESVKMPLATLIRVTLSEPTTTATIGELTGFVTKSTKENLKNAKD